MAIAPPSHHLSSFFLLIVLTAHLLLSYSTTTFATTTSTAALDIHVELIHVDAHRSFTHLERLHRAASREKHRLRKLHEKIRHGKHQAQGDADVEVSVEAGVGEYLMNLAIGTPPRSFSAMVDTGSPLVWTQCDPCINCSNREPIFSPSNSSSFSRMLYSNPLCASLTSRVTTLDNSTGGCNYRLEYETPATSQGYLALETLTLGSGNRTVSFKNIGFGCGNHNQGFDEGAGIVGLDRSPLSLVSQLGSSIDNRFSYCFTLFNDSVYKSSRLVLGHSAALISSDASTTTPLVVNPLFKDSYLVNLEDISVGGKRLLIPSGYFRGESYGVAVGGTIIDSGSALTNIVPPAYM
jgi:hypothetical protein